jgi:hypothetical protein
MRRRPTPDAAALHVLALSSPLRRRVRERAAGGGGGAFAPRRALSAPRTRIPLPPCCCCLVFAFAEEGNEAGGGLFSLSLLGFDFFDSGFPFTCAESDRGHFFFSPGSFGFLPLRLTGLWIILCVFREQNQ